MKAREPQLHPPVPSPPLFDRRPRTRTPTTSRVSPNQPAEVPSYCRLPLFPPIAVWLTHGGIHEGVLRVKEAALALPPAAAATAVGGEGAGSSDAGDASGAGALFAKVARSSGAPSSSPSPSDDDGASSSRGQLLDALSALATKAASSYALAAELSGHAAAQAR